MHDLRETGFLRLSQIIGNPKANPPIPPIIPVGKLSIWAWVKAKRFPAPVKLGPRVTAEDVRSIRRFLDEHAAAPDEKAAA